MSQEFKSQEIKNRLIELPFLCDFINFSIYSNFNIPRDIKSAPLNTREQVLEEKVLEERGQEEKVAPVEEKLPCRVLEESGETCTVR